MGKLTLLNRQAQENGYDLLAKAYCAESEAREKQLMDAAFGQGWDDSDETFKTLFVAMSEFLVLRRAFCRKRGGKEA